MKSTSIKLSLDRRRPKADGSFPIILRLTHNGKSTSIKTGVSVPGIFWDEEASQVKSSYKCIMNVKRLNNELQKKKAEALDKVLKLDENQDGQFTTVGDVSKKLSSNRTSASFYEFAAKLIKELILTERIGTARSYTGVVSVLKTFNKGKPLEKNQGGYHLKSKNKNLPHYDLSFAEISYSFLTKLENYHLATGNEVNGLAVYMRTIRSIYNKAIKEGLVEQSLYPFNSYKIRTKPTQKRALEQDHLRQIINLDLTPEDPCFNARNYFVASYLMYGMNFADMAQLRKTDCVDGRVQYRRRKTSKLYDIKITDNLQEILSHYSEQAPESAYVFPIIKRDTAILQARDVQWARKAFNKNLKTIAEKCGIKQKLTSYVSRHSFATHAMLSEVPVTAISTMLGHSSLKTTEIYLKSLPSNVLDDYNARVLKLNT